MFQEVFCGNDYSYSHEAETDQFLLYDNNYSDHVVLKDYDVYLFRKSIGIFYSQSEQEQKKFVEGATAFFLQNRY